MKKINLPLLFFLFSGLEVQVQAAEKEAVVIEVRKNIALSKNDKVYKNFFINGGGKLGLTKGTVVDVLRRLPMHDPIKNISVGDLRVKVGELEIVQGDEYLSVAKLVSSENPENRAVLDYDAVMVGDRLDLSSLRQPSIPLAPDVNALMAPSAALEGEKIALLNRSDKAKSLMKEGERHLETLSNLKMDTKPQAQNTRQLASVEKKLSSKKKSTPKKKK